MEMEANVKELAKAWEAELVNRCPAETKDLCYRRANEISPSIEHFF